MSLVPTSVSVLSCLENDLVFGCTISSLVSVNIDETNPEIVFVLKKNSLVGKKIRSGNFFTINVLSINQEILAKKYSNSRDPDLISEVTWRIQDNFVELRDSRLTLNCKPSRLRSLISYLLA
ncbi:MAG: flavin reductase [Chitinophagia bacterium]|nr:flavin reductase [Chitinophagia bacterium]